MMYQKVYDGLVKRFKESQFEGYVEDHHIIPRCLGGTDDPENIVRMTAKAHFIAHYLLIKIHPDCRQLWYAFRMMTNGCVSDNQQRGYRVNAKVYDLCKRTLSRLGRSEETKQRMREANLGKKASEETKQKMRESNRKWLDEVGVSEETRQKISKGLTGKKVPEETKDKIRKALSGKKLPVETREKMKEAHARNKPSRVGVKRSEESVERMKVSQKIWRETYVVSHETKSKISSSMAGKPKSEETRQKMKAAWEIRRQKLMNLEIH